MYYLPTLLHRMRNAILRLGCLEVQDDRAPLPLDKGLLSMNSEYICGSARVDFESSPVDLLA